MDCGPAALKSLLEGFGIPISYGRLREACHTDLDGASIDTVELVANQLGLDAEQILLPIDHLPFPEAKALPAIVVVTTPGGLTHFVVVWRRCGNLLQVMDPGVGRRWICSKQFLSEVYGHAMPASATDWREFAASTDFQVVLDSRLRELGISRAHRRNLTAQALGDETWHSLAAFDAAVRLTQSLFDAGGIRKAGDCVRLIERFMAAPERIPQHCWSVRPGPEDGEGNQQVLMRGAILLRVRGTKPVADRGNLGMELTVAVSENPLGPGRELLKAIWESGSFAPAVVLFALLIAGGGTLVEALLFRGLFDLTAALGLTGQRIGAIAAALLFCSALLLLEFPTFACTIRLGRHVENRLRVAFLKKISKLGDRYFQSRPISDMAERSHATQRLRDLPGQVRQLLRATFEFGFTAAGIVWLEPSYAVYVLAISVAALVPALVVQPLLTERDLRVRSHSGGLTRFYLDSMLGLLAIRAHGAERAVRREHERLLGEWANASIRLQRVVVFTEALQLIAIFGLIAALVLFHPLQGVEIGRLLLIVYWALNLPALGQDIITSLRQYPTYRNLTLRLLEPLGAPEESTNCIEEETTVAKPPSIDFRDVSVQVSGHTILEEVSCSIEAGSHVAIVGLSGAGKSSLVGVILGWLKPAKGNVLVDGKPLDPAALRRCVAWVDPSVQLWNRSLAANLSYGSSSDTQAVAQAIDAAMLRNVLETLECGLQTKLGESGALVSGGEGQRVRLGRALLRENTRLVILDEPFRGLDREKRSALLTRAREMWGDCTLLCITHDIAETKGFDRVLVIEHRRIVENGAPQELAANSDTRYSQLLAAEEETRIGLWESKLWRRIRIHAGRIVEDLPLNEECILSPPEEPETEVAC